MNIEHPICTLVYTVNDFLRLFSMFLFFVCSLFSVLCVVYFILFLFWLGSWFGHNRMRVSAIQRTVNEMELTDTMVFVYFNHKYWGVFFILFYFIAAFCCLLPLGYFILKLRKILISYILKLSCFDFLFWRQRENIDNNSTAKLQCFISLIINFLLQCDGRRLNQQREKKINKIKNTK